MRRSVSLLLGVLVLLTTGVTSAATRLRGFPVKLEGQADVAPPLAVDIDADGRLEIVVATRNQLSVVESDGSPVEGFPVSFPRGSGISSALAVAELGPAPGVTGATALPSVVFATADGSLAVIEASGKPRPGFPVKLTAPAAGAPTVGDLDGDGQLEILIGTTAGHIDAIRGDGRHLPGYPAKVTAPVTTSITLGRFDPKGDPVLVFGDDKGRLHAWSRPGRELPGFPYKAKFTLAGQPVLGDVNDDGRFEVAVGSKDYRLHVVGPNGKALDGFPVETGYRIYAACAMVDLDADGVVEVLAASGDGKLYAVSGLGKAVRGFPVKIGGRLRASPVAADIDLDGRPEIVIGSDRGKLFVLRADGKQYPGFPARLRDKLQVAASLADLDGNQTLEIAALSKDGSLSVYKLLKKGQGSPAPGWPTEGRDLTRTGVVHPNPPRYADLAISPESPDTTEPLKLSYRFFDLDGDPEPATRIRWYTDDKPVEALDGKRQVPASMTAKHQKWRFSLQASEGGRVFSSPVVAVRNTPPGAPVVDLGPQPARTGDDLRLQIRTESKDVDRDKVRYRIAWLRDRRPQKGFSKDRIPARRTRKGQRWTVVVTPSDGEVDGRPARASLTIANTAPGAPKVALVPPRPTATQPVQVTIQQAAKDPDGDPVEYAYRWFAADAELNLPESQGTLPAGMVPKHGQIRVEVTSLDGQDRGGTSEAGAEVVNTPPAAPKIQIQPTAPRTGDDLRALLIGPSADPDGDPISYRFTWRRKGKAYSGAHAGRARLPASETAKGEHWILLAIPNDGEGDGKSAQTEVVIGNSPPVAPELRPVDARPDTTRDLEVRVAAPTKDPDGDRAWCQVVWSRDGKQVAAGKQMWRLPAARTVKHGRYLAEATPTDGQDTGGARRVWFVVQNSPPSACAVAIEPAEPTAVQGLRARLTKPSTDADGDKIRYRYSWSRDGEPIEPTGRNNAVAAAQTARGQRWVVEVTPSDGEVDGPACRATAVVANQAPSGPALVFSPKRPTAVDELRLEFSRPAVDPDRDDLVTHIRWSVDGRPFPPADDARSVPRGVLRKGQRWQVEVVVSDGSLSSPPAKAEVRVGNAPPAAPEPAIWPLKPLSSDELRCRLAASTGDPDGDRLEHRYEWYRLGRKTKTPKGKPRHVGARLPADKTRKGQRWMCRVKASDGSLTGPAGQAEVRVGNAAPTAPAVRIEPATPGADQPLVCVISEPAVDPDGDRVRYRFQWFKDGVAQPFAAQTDRVPVRLTRAKDIWQCRVVPGDGQLEGPPAESQEVLIGAPSL